MEEKGNLELKTDKIGIIDRDHNIQEAHIPTVNERLNELEETVNIMKDRILTLENTLHEHGIYL